MTVDGSWTKEEASQLRKKAYKFFLQSGKIWRHPNKRNDAPLWVVMRIEDQSVLMKELHKSPWYGNLRDMGHVEQKEVLVVENV